MGEPGPDQDAFALLPVSRDGDVVVTGRRDILELARNETDRGADGDEMDPLERGEPLESAPEPTVAPGATVRLRLRAWDQQEDRFGGRRTISLEEAGPEPDHLGTSMGLEEDVVARTGERDRGPFLEETVKLPVGVAEHLGERRLGHETGFHQFSEAPGPGGRDGLGGGPTARGHRVRG